MKILSLFDGISCGKQAIERLNWADVEYSASEIDKYAEAVSKFNYPEIERLGDITKLKVNQHYDLVIGGSPCQSFSNAGKKEGFKGKSGLFWEFVRVLNEARKINPNVLFLLENVKMKKEWQDIISAELGVKPIEINANLVSAQNRRRLFWTNIKGITQPNDKGILLKDIIQKEVDEKYYLTDHQIKYATEYSKKRGKTIESAWDRDKSRTLLARAPKRACHDTTLIKGAALRTWPRNKIEGVERRKRLETRKDEKSNCLTTIKTDNLVDGNEWVRVLTPIEFERLQTIEDNFTQLGLFEDGVKEISDNQRYTMLGNAWCVDVIVWILSFIDTKDL